MNYQPLLYPIVCRILREDESLPIPRDVLVAIRQELERYHDILEDVDLDKPSTLLSLVDRIVEDNMPEKQDWSDAFEFTQVLDLVDFDPLEGLMEEAVERLEPNRMVWEGKDTQFWEIHPQVLWECDKSSGKHRLWMPDSQYLTEAIQAIRPALWGDRQSVRVDTDGNDLHIDHYDLSGHDYIGPIEDLMDKAIQMYRADWSWTMLLQGKPGVGKTTFCRHLARQLGGRTMFAPKSLFASLRCQDWQEVIKVLDPDILILDDPDYVGRYELREKLNLLSTLEVPLTLITSNNIDLFPEAMKRPGRIDHIEVVGSPGKYRMEAMLEQKAAHFDVTVPSEYVDQLCEILWEHSPAHLEEVFKRAQAWGWEAEKTFDLYKKPDDDES